MKRNIAIIVCLAISSMVLSQKNDLDIIFLKDRTTIKGIIIEQVPYQTITVVTPKRDTVVLSIDAVEKVSRKSYPGSKNLISQHFQQATRSFILESGLAISLTDEYSTFLKMNLIRVYRINPKIFAGIGTGLRYHLMDNQITSMDIDFSPLFNDIGVPVFADVRTVFNMKKVSGFAAIDLGYSFDLSNNPVYGIYYVKPGIFPFTHIAGAGFLVCPTFGIAFVTSEKSAINLGLSFETHFYQNYWQYSSVRYSPSVSAGINIGILF
jgi:hypothetical protein